jgi:hypothetical protein
MKRKRRVRTEVPSWRSSKRWLVVGGLHAIVVVMAVAMLVPSGVAHTAAARRPALATRQVSKRGLGVVERAKLRAELTSVLRRVAAYQAAVYAERGEYARDLSKLAGFAVPAGVEVVIEAASKAGWLATARMLAVPEVSCASNTKATPLAAEGAGEGDVVCK